MLLKHLCLDLLVLADLHSASNVRMLALKFIVENGKEIASQVDTGLFIYRRCQTW